MKIQIRGGRVVDPGSGLDRVQDIFVAAGKVTGLGGAPSGFHANRVIEAAGLIVCPGLVDLSRDCASRDTSTRRHSKARWPRRLPAG
jgi:dihydroorotase